MYIPHGYIYFLFLRVGDEDEETPAENTTAYDQRIQELVVRSLATMEEDSGFAEYIE